MNALRAQLERGPGERIVLESEAGSTSAGQLLERVEALSKLLQTRGAATIGLLCDNSVEWVVADLACQFQGLRLVPLPTFFSDGQLQYVLAAAGVDTLVYDRTSAPRIASLPAVTHADTAACEGLELRPLTVAGEAAMPPATAKLTFTSGSTGQPKGVCLATAQCLRVARSLGQVIDIRSPRHLCALPLSTLLENIAGIYLPLLMGGCSLVYSAASMGMAGSSGVQPAEFLRAIEQRQPETMILVPQLLSLIDSAISGGWQAPQSLRFVAVGGGRVAPAVVERCRAAGFPVYEGYGLSECASVVSLNTPRAEQAATSGRVLPHVQVEVDRGELLVSGNTFLGYLNQPESWGASQVRTGDLGRLDDQGYLRVEGRCKNVLVSSYGRNISPEWVESELQASGPIQQAVVLGDGMPYCSALIWAAPTAGEQLIQQQIDEVNRGLPDYARVRRWQRLQEPMTVRNGLLTDNGRPRRNAIASTCSELIEQLYGEPQECKLI
ncbi:AMP-binding protein [Seongchinamella sediminis]|uniref:AMP-binding protein n=1 Tax=Seongchinamella sediminis TaxID=2283635 RepID=UPI0013C3135A|nr:AMP-binding protein [Seongchinamella sediminis]